jgi:hypothetical protein
MSPDDLERRALAWRKSRRSTGNGECVEVASTPRTVVVRDSKDPIGPMLRYPAQAWQTFLIQAKIGKGFD